MVQGEVKGKHVTKLTLIDKWFLSMVRDEVKRRKKFIKDSRFLTLRGIYYLCRISNINLRIKIRIFVYSVG